jgi:hypothetical protein
MMSMIDASFLFFDLIEIQLKHLLFHLHEYLNVQNLLREPAMYMIMECSLIRHQID